MNIILQILHRRKLRKSLETKYVDLQRIFSMSDRKIAFFSLSDFYEKADSKLRNEIRSGWDFNLKWIYPNMETLAQTIPGDNCPEIKIRACFIFCVISPSSDYRDDLSTYAYIYHSAIDIGMDVVKLFKDMADMADSSTSKLILNFINRPNEGKSLTAWGLVRISEAYGVKFVFKNTDIP